MRTTDNNYKGIAISADEAADLQHLANLSLEELAGENNYPNLLIFPNNLDKNKDGIGKNILFSLQNNMLKTQNTMGFISHNNTQLQISSRFYKKGDDYFLHYMLQKVFQINILNFNIDTTRDDEIWDIFLLYLFPFHLKKALNQGLYKNYQRNKYNDANVKGSINVAQHIRQNTPFLGKIAYTTREHTYDNSLTQLIRHTIQFIKNHRFGGNILNNDQEMRQIIQQINTATPSFHQRNLQKIIQDNQKPINHPFFTEYEPLRRLCLQILRQETISFGSNETEQTFGIVFDGAWLWEEYLNTILKNCGFKHAKYSSKEHPIYLFGKSRGVRYPDFWKENFIIDAKYKRLANKAPNRDDMHQIISYMYIQKAEIGGFMVPSDMEDRANLIKKRQLNGYGGSVYVWTLFIPQQASNFVDFCNEMKVNENLIIEKIETLETKIDVAL
jgi:5-methylcytosine-specific restriction enzyme subunit McrC